MKYLPILCLFLVSCGCPKISRKVEWVSYPVDKSECVKTPLGACVIPNGNPLPEEKLQRIDEMITATERCIQEWNKTKPDVLHRNYHWKPPKRSCYVIIFPDDWRKSCINPEQGIFGKAPQESCAAKGLEEDPDCPCGFRVCLQKGRYIVVAPDLALFRSGIVELLSGYPTHELWAEPALVECSGW